MAPFWMRRIASWPGAEAVSTPVFLPEANSRSTSASLISLRVPMSDMAK